LLEKPAISDTQIQTCLQEKYGLTTVRLDFLPWGNDANGWVYRVTGEGGASYFLKLKRGTLYPPTCLVPHFLKEQGIAEVAAPLLTKAHEPWAQLGELAVILYPFIEGDNGWNTGMSDRRWQELGVALKSIHSLVPPAYLLAELRKERFDLTEYLGLNELDRQLYIMEGSDRLEREFIAIWTAKRPIIFTLLNQMVKLAEILRNSSLPLVICHADLHPGNILIDRQDRLFIIDWDDVMLAPKERDFIFVEVEDANGESPDPNEHLSPFFQGYGKVEIDWIALTYYRCERVIQDVLAHAQEILFRPDFGEENRTSSVRWFGKMFEPGEEVEAALATIKQLPAQLDFS
jgi:spectinomycin phosphotransferase